MSYIWTLEEIEQMPEGQNHGYIIRYPPDGGRYKTVEWELEHRLIAEAHLGRRLLRTEHVHHDDENRQHNSWDNLTLKSPSEHAKHHHPKEGEMRRCVICHAGFYPRAAHLSYDRQTCSRQCNWKLPETLQRRRLYLNGRKPDYKLNAEIIRLHTTGMTLRVVASQLGITYSSCKQRYTKWSKRQGEPLYV